jgi:hypothetical protein
MVVDRGLLAGLAEMPDLLRRVASELTPEQSRRRPRDGHFSFVEHAWHLADLEREGYGARVIRLLTESEPWLPDFDGERAAREREYQHGDPALAVEVFSQARRRNLERLGALDGEALQRRGLQEGVGVVALVDVPRMMDEHDESHLGELVELLSEIAPGVPVLDILRAVRLAHRPPPSAGGRRQSVTA